jgi:DNA-binding beta-propeller fold protein YncE
MSSDEMRPSDETSEPVDAQAPLESLGPDDALERSEPIVIARGSAERARRRKLAIFALLLLVVALLAYTAYYFDQNRRFPIPTIVPASVGIEPPQYLYSIGGAGAGALSKPIGVAVSPDNRVYVVDFVKREIKAYTTEGAFLFAFNKIDDGADKALRNPVHLAIDAQNNVWVTDRRLKSVYVFDRNGKFLRKFLPNNDAAFEWSPFGITVDAAGDVYICDVPGVQVHRILVFDKAGRLKTMFGQAGQVLDAKASPGTLSYPNGIAISSGTGNIRDLYVADSNNRRVQVFSPDGTFRKIIATEGTPRGIALDSKKQLYVVDVLSHQIDIFAASGQRLATFGENGFGPGQFQYPEDLAVDGRDRIYISDRENNQVQVWGFRKAEIPGITKIAPGQWGWCLLPLPLLLLPLLLRKRRFVATQDFVEGMVVAELVPKMVNRGWRWIVPESIHAAFVGRVIDGVNLGDLLEPQPYSYSDANALATKLGIPIDRAGVLAMAKRARTLCTEDSELARLAVLLDIDVYDRVAFVQRFIERRK